MRRNKKRYKVLIRSWLLVYLFWRAGVTGLVPVFAMLVILGCGKINRYEAVRAAARAPYIAFWHGNAGKLCGSFIPKIAAELAIPSSQNGQCDVRVAAVLAKVPFAERVPRSVGAFTFKVIDVKLESDYATAILLYRDGAQSLAAPIRLDYLDGKWRVATHSILGVVGSCPHGIYHRYCSSVVQRAFLLVGGSAVSGLPSLISAPSFVQRAGKREQAVFEYGDKVFVSTGCLACHRIGPQGNSGPGSELTHVGAELSEEEIEKSLIDTSPPMPSFRGLPKEKFEALARFLSLLRG